MQTKACQALNENELSQCDSKNLCHYKLFYGDGSYYVGDLAIDTFWFGQTLFKKVVFGCGREYKGKLPSHIGGIVGLGGGNLSILNQLNSSIQGKFSYCLIPHFNEKSSNKTSKIHFGNDAVLSGSGVVSTPIYKTKPSVYHFVTLIYVVVGDKNSSYNRHIRKDHFESGNIIIDSGIMFSSLPLDIYDGVSASFIKAIGRQPVQDTSRSFEICYMNLNLELVPSLTFEFFQANVVVPPEKMFLEVEKGLSCFTIFSTDGWGYFGSLLQQNLLVGFDLVNQKVSFKPTDCTMH